MTNEEAIRNLQSVRSFLNMTDLLDEPSYKSINMAIEAVEKQIPKKPYKRQMKVSTIDVCPVCGIDTPNPRELEQWEWWCPDCGQKIDWSEVEE